MSETPVESLQFGEAPNPELNGSEEAEEVIKAVVLLAHRAVWLGKEGVVSYDLDEACGDGIPAMRVTITVTPGQ